MSPEFVAAVEINYDLQQKHALQAANELVALIPETAWEPVEDDPPYLGVTLCLVDYSEGARKVLEDQSVILRAKRVEAKITYFELHGANFAITIPQPDSGDMPSVQVPDTGWRTDSVRTNAWRYTETAIRDILNREIEIHTYSGKISVLSEDAENVQELRETMSESLTPEQRVFGGDYFLMTGDAGQDERVALYFERYLKLEEGEVVWIPRTLDGENGIAADLYNDCEIIATLDFDYETKLADVYVTSESGEFGDTTLCEQVSFDDAVDAAENYSKSL